MAYKINKTNGETLVENLQEGYIDYDTVSNIGLIGKLTPSYGECQSENFVKLAENFANKTPPLNPLLGMTYFNTDDKTLYICTDESTKKWTKLSSIRFEQISEPMAGELYYDKENKILYIYDDTILPFGEWVAIGPNNFLNKRMYSYKDSALAGNAEVVYKEIEFDDTSSNLVTVKIIAREELENSENRDRDAQCSAWIYKFFVNSQKMNDNSKVVKIIGTPTYELIGQTDNAEKWRVEVSIDTNMLCLKGFGYTDDKRAEIIWEFDVEVLKV